MSRKHSVNNLIIVWQGQSWSVIAPDGQVVARFKDKEDATSFALGKRDFSAQEIPEYKDMFTLKKKRSYISNGSYQTKPSTYSYRLDVIKFPKWLRILIMFPLSVAVILIILILSFMLLEIIFLEIVDFINYLSSFTLIEIIYSPATIPALFILNLIWVFILWLIDERWSFSCLTKWSSFPLGCLAIWGGLGGFLIGGGLILFSLFTPIKFLPTVAVTGLWLGLCYSTMFFTERWKNPNLP